MASCFRAFPMSWMLQVRDNEIWLRKWLSDTEEGALLTSLLSPTQTADGTCQHFLALLVKVILEFVVTN